MSDLLDNIDMTDPYKRLFFAADVEDLVEVVKHVDQMSRLFWIKIDRSFLDECDDGWDVFSFLRKSHLKIFDDAKIIGEDRSVERTALGHIRRAKPDLLSCMAGTVSKDFKKESDALRRFATVCKDHGVEPCGVSVLSTKSEELVVDEFGGRDSIQQVEWYAHQLMDADIRLMVCSAHEAKILKKWTTLEGLRFITPGIRPEGWDSGTHPRCATPAEAIECGSDLLVIGEPIYKAKDPAAALDAIAAEIQPLLTTSDAPC